MNIDARNMPCPRPVVLALKALSELSEGDALEILVNEHVAVENLERMASEKECSFEVHQMEGYTQVRIAPLNATVRPSEQFTEPVVCDIATQPRYTGMQTLIFGSDTLGSGYDELGKILIKGLIFALTEQEQLPQTLVFYNAGATLTSDDSPVLEDLKTLENKGVQIFTCGTCLDFLDIKDHLAVGGVTNLYVISGLLGTSSTAVVC